MTDTQRENTRVTSKTCTCVLPEMPEKDLPISTRVNGVQVCTSCHHRIKDLAHVSGVDTNKTRVQVPFLPHDVSLVVRRLGTATRVAAEALTALGVCVQDCQDALDEQTDKES